MTQNPPLRKMSVDRSTSFFVGTLGMLSMASTEGEVLGPSTTDGAGEELVTSGAGATGEEMLPSAAETAGGTVVLSSAKRTADVKVVTIKIVFNRNNFILYLF